MRKIVVAEHLSLDGIFEDPGGSEQYKHGGWTHPYFHEDIQKVVAAGFSRMDAFLLGRVTYQGFEAAFSSQTGDVADRMNSKIKYVVSTTLKEAKWNNSTLIKGNVAEEITKLKQQPGKDILVVGSAMLIQTLRQHDLIDEYSLLVYPVILGSGRHLFTDDSKTPLKLFEAKVLGSGVVHLSYQPDAAA